MHLVYFDEVKYQPGIQPYYWMGGIVVPCGLVSELEVAVNDLSAECFGLRTLRKETEFHAKDIFHGKGNFKEQKDVAARISLLERLAKIIDRHDEIGKVFARIEPERLRHSKDYEDMAFMYFVERVQMYLKRESSIGMLIGDHEKARNATDIYNLSRFRMNGTDYSFGITIDKLIDTVHYSHSHHSRLLQLADVFMFANQLCAANDNGKYPRRRFQAYVRNETKLLHTHRYKLWPAY